MFDALPRLRVLIQGISKELRLMFIFDPRSLIHGLPSRVYRVFVLPPSFCMWSLNPVLLFLSTRRMLSLLSIERERAAEPDSEGLCVPQIGRLPFAMLSGNPSDSAQSRGKSLLSVPSS